ncbi:MAG: 30S ribosomal protein S3 [Candidatus Ratteibacteria bacterium]
MGQKVNPIGLRIGIVEQWRSKWFSPKKEFKNLLREDVMIRDYIKKRYPRGTITKIEIEKTDKIRIRLYTPRPGVVLGRKGAEINQLRDELYEIFKKQITIDCIEINQPGTSAQFLADSIVIQLEKRVPHRQAIKKAMDLAIQSGAKGIKVRISGRIGGVEIARSEQYILGKVPLHTLRAKIDYATSTAFTRSGTVGVKVWVYLGEILEEKGEKDAPNA